MTLTTLLANLLATGCAVLLMRRGATPRLRWLTLVVGLASFSQSAAVFHLHAGFLSPALSTAHGLLVGFLSLVAIYLLGQEIYDRNLTDRLLRITEHELMLAQAREHTAMSTQLAQLQSMLRDTTQPAQSGLLAAAREREAAPIGPASFSRISQR